MLTSIKLEGELFLLKLPQAKQFIATTKVLFVHQL